MSLIACGSAHQGHERFMLVILDFDFLALRRG